MYLMIYSCGAVYLMVLSGTATKHAVVLPLSCSDFQARYRCHAVSTETPCNATKLSEALLYRGRASALADEHSVKKISLHKVKLGTVHITDSSGTEATPIEIDSELGTKRIVSFYNNQSKYLTLSTNILAVLKLKAMDAAVEGNCGSGYETEAVDEDALKEVEELVDTAASELQEVLEDNPELKETLEKSLEEIREAVKSTDPKMLEDAVTDVVESYDRNSMQNHIAGGDAPGTKLIRAYTDSKVILEVQEAERQAQQTATIINDLKLSVAHLLEKPQMTDKENNELEEKNKLLAQQLQEFEYRTRQVQVLVSQIDKRADAMPGFNFISTTESRKPTDDGEMIPKVVFSKSKENLPMSVNSESEKTISQHNSAVFNGPPAANVMPQFARRLNESYNMQEKLAAENADLEGKRYKLQEEIINKDQTVESLHRKLNSLQAELRLVVKENTILSDKLNKVGDGTGCSSKSRTNIKDKSAGDMACGGKGICPGDVESRLQNYSNTTHVLEKQLGQMETQVRNMQNELECVQRERAMLEQQRKGGGVKCSGPCAPGGGPGGGSGVVSGGGGGKPPCGGPCNAHRSVTGGGGGGGGAEQQLRELREQYKVLQEDYKNKLTEVAGMRADADKLKQIAKEAEFEKDQIEQTLRDKEKELKMHSMDRNKLAGSKEQLVEQEQQLNIAKQRFREAQDELDELRSLVGDQTSQLEDYRNKYLAAQQTVEEQRRQLDVMEMENQRISEQVNLEIQRVKNQFQEKLQELTPLPDILKATQLKLQEAQQMQICAERTAEKMEAEVQREKDKHAALLSQIEQARSSEQLGADAQMGLQRQLEAWEKKFNDLRNENERIKTEAARLEESSEQNEKRLGEKLHEVTQLSSQLEQLREESARQVARAKDRCETVRRSLQSQISELERQLAQSRAACRSATKDRDDIRQKMQCQINNLNESFEQAQMRIRSLQGHVNFLKTSYSNIFAGADDTPALGDGMDTSCNCNTNF